MDQVDKIKEIFARLNLQDRQEAIEYIISTVIAKELVEKGEMPIRTADGVVVGHIIQCSPSVEEIASAWEEVKEVKPESTHPAGGLSRSMQLKDRKGVEQFR